LFLLVFHIQVFLTARSRVFEIMGTIQIGMNACRLGTTTDRLLTTGLATCVGVIVYGLPPKRGTAYNKGIAHASPKGNDVDTYIGRLIEQVRASGMVVEGWVISQADHTINDEFDDNELRAELLSDNTIPFDPSRLTARFLAEYRARSKREIEAANDRAHHLCLYRLNINGVKSTRDNSDFHRPMPYGTMEATASPGGEVLAEGLHKAVITDPPTGAAGPGTGRSEKKRGGHTSGSHTASGHHDQAGSSSSAPRKTTTTSSSSSSSSSSSNTTKKVSGGNSSSGGHSKPKSRHPNGY
jgi:hypothetical protein